MGDECLVAPLSLFNTELLNVTGTGKLAKVQKTAANQPDPEDCFDAEYLRETGVSSITYDSNSVFNNSEIHSIILQRKGAREQMEQSQAEGGGLIPGDNVEEEIVVDTLEVEQRETKDKEFVVPGGQIIGLDQAVLQSIERCRKCISV